MESKRKGVVLTITEKLEVCKAAKRGPSLSSLATEYVIGKARVHDILKSEGKLKDFRRSCTMVTAPVSHPQACQALEALLAYYEQQPGVPQMSTTVLLSGLMMQAAKKRG